MYRVVTNAVHRMLLISTDNA